MSGLETFGAVKILAVFGVVLWFAWSQARRMERAVAEARRDAAAAPPAAADPGNGAGSAGRGPDGAPRSAA